MFLKRNGSGNTPLFIRQMRVFLRFFDFRQTGEFFLCERILSILIDMNTITCMEKANAGTLVFDKSGCFLPFSL